MKKIDFNRLPEILTPELIDILVEMAMEFPKKNDEWEKISNILLQRNQLNLILDIVEKYKNEEREKKWNSLSVDCQNEELKKKRRKFKKQKILRKHG